ncbi:MAG: alpha/beta fold hydrolase [Planctomycetaceae bacterium]|nr:alpha/beta fold hydrolase [Planctomycetaceae bacterium]
MSSPELRSLVVSDGCRLTFRHWTASDQKLGNIVAIHGIQSHSGWYEYSSARLAQAGYDVYFADRRGSGLNTSDRGHSDHGLRLLNDVRSLIDLVRQEDSSSPVTLLGLSWGGKIAAAFAATYPGLIDCLVLLYPGLKTRIGPRWWESVLLRLARLHDIRRREVPVPLSNPKQFTGSPEAQQFIRDDRLAIHLVTTGFLNSGRDLDRIISTSKQSIRHPVLLMLAGNDQIIDNRAVRQIVQSFASTDITTIEYPGAAHTLEFEPVRDDFVSALIEWLVSRTGRRRTLSAASSNATGFK